MSSGTVTFLFIGLIMLGIATGFIYGSIPPAFVVIGSGMIAIAILEEIVQFLVRSGH